MSYLGDYVEDYATLNFQFTTRTTTGAPTELAGTPVLSVYPAASDAQITAGITLDVNFDAVTGLNHVTIDLAGYAVAQDYAVVITTGTVGGVSVVGEVVAQFSIENRFKEVDLTHVGGLAISDNLATLKLKQLHIVNSAGDAIVGTSNGSNGQGMVLTGHGTASGLFASGGSTGNGITGLGGTAGYGILGKGGPSSGAGIRGEAQANNDAGMELVKHGTGKDIDATPFDGADNKVLISTDAQDMSATLDVNTKTVTNNAITAAAIAAAAIDNATFAADVQTTAYATNIIALAVFKALQQFNLDHLMKTAVASGADMTTEVADGTVLSNIMTETGDTSDFVRTTDSLEAIGTDVAADEGHSTKIDYHSTRLG